jgi:hypothetical protein
VEQAPAHSHHILEPHALNPLRQSAVHRPASTCGQLANREAGVHANTPPASLHRMVSLDG